MNGTGHEARNAGDNFFSFFFSFFFLPRYRSVVRVVTTCGCRSHHRLLPCAITRGSTRACERCTREFDTFPLRGKSVLRAYFRVFFPRPNQRVRRHSDAPPASYPVLLSLGFNGSSFRGYTAFAFSFILSHALPRAFPLSGLLVSLFYVSYICVYLSSLSFCTHSLLHRSSFFACPFVLSSLRFTVLPSRPLCSLSHSVVPSSHLSSVHKQCCGRFYRAYALFSLNKFNLNFPVVQNVY